MTLAHGFVTPGDVWEAWAPHPVAPLLLVAAAAWFAWGAGLIRRRPPARNLAFWAGLFVLLIALASPLDALGETLFSAHMAQHLLLTIAAAPLLAYGTPTTPMVRALPAGVRHRIARLKSWPPPLRHGPLVALVVHTSVLWAWHLPVLYGSAVRNDALHSLEHACFLGSAFWFWATILPARKRGSAPHPVRILALFGNLLQSGALGVLLLFATRPLYPIHRAGSLAWGMTPLADQQLAGVLMWVPPGAVQFVAMVILAARWLSFVEARIRAGEAMPRA